MGKSAVQKICDFPGRVFQVITTKMIQCFHANIPTNIEIQRLQYAGVFSLYDKVSKTKLLVKQK